QAPYSSVLSARSTPLRRSSRKEQRPHRSRRLLSDSLFSWPPSFATCRGNDLSEPNTPLASSVCESNPASPPMVALDSTHHARPRAPRLVPFDTPPHAPRSEGR